MASTFRLDMTHIRCCQEAFESAVHILLQPRWSSKSESRFLAGSGGCPYSPKTDLRKQRDFSTDRLRAQLRIHTLGQLQTVAIPNSRHSTFDMNGIMRGNLLPVSWRILFLPVAFDISRIRGYFDDLCRVSLVPSRATRTRTRRNRRHRVRCRRGPVSVRRWVATTTVWTMGAVAKRPHMVARSPATVARSPATVGTVGFVVVQPDAHAAVISVSATIYLSLI